MARHLTLCMNLSLSAKKRFLNLAIYKENGAESAIVGFCISSFTIQGRSQTSEQDEASLSLGHV